MTTDTLDIRITESNPLESFDGDSQNFVGFDADGVESRLLLYFPNIKRIYEPKFIKSGMTSATIRINVQEVLASPENIELLPLAATWTPYATWTSRFASLKSYAWQTPGGDTVPGATPIMPAMRRNPNDAQYFELNFDITNYASELAAYSSQSYGFLVRLRKSPLNGADNIIFLASNSSDSNARPSATLEFVQAEIGESK